MNINEKISIAKNVSIISGVFCILVALLLLLNYFQYAKSEPVESKTIEALVERLHSDPNNDQLREEIREFDLLARKAYFNSRWQVKTGAYLLLFGAVVFALGLRAYYSYKAKIEKPGQLSEDEITGRILSQRWIIFTGAAVIVLALVASFASVNYLDDYDASQLAEATVEETDESIEVIEVAKPESQKEAPVQNENISLSPDSSVVDKIEEAPAEVREGKAEEESKEAVSEPVANNKAAAVAGPSDEQILANYSGFRGPYGQGVSNHKNIPVEFNGANGTNLLWKADVAKKGYNSPVIWENKVFLSGGDKDAREVYCFDLKSGKLLWSKKADNIPGSPATMPRVTEDTGLAASSVTTDGENVVAIFATGDIICFDTDGNRKWARNLGVPNNHYGHSSSLINWNGKVFIQYDTNSGGKVLALNISTGETVWETARNASISWASPVLADVNGKKQVVLSADPIVAGYDTETGEELWSVECMMGEVGPSVAVGEGMIFAANEYARLAAINPLDASIVWEDDYYLPEVASPVYSNGLVFVATSYGILVCYNAKNGELLWEEDYGTGFYASPVICDNKVYALDTDGVVHILEVNREAKLLAESELGEEGFATPAFAEGKILFRCYNSLYCFGK